MAEEGMRRTKAQLMIVELLRRSEECLTVEQIHARLRSSGQKVGLATVYRTVTKLGSFGEILRVDAGDGSARFEAVEAGPEGHHHYLICVKCHRVRKYAQFSQEELDLMRRTERALARRFKYRITGHRIYFEGVCPECRSVQ